MRKVKWMIFNSPFLLGDIGDRLKDKPFSEENGLGFIFTKIRKSELHGKFIEKYTIEEKIKKLYAEEIIIERLEYRTTEFNFREDCQPFIEFLNPPRTIKPFSIALVNNLGLGVSLDEIDIDPVLWFEKISINYPFRISQIDISQIAVTDAAIAKMQITSSKNLKKYYLSEVANKKNRVDKIVISIESPTLTGKIKLSRTGMAHLDLNHENDILKVLLDALNKLIFDKDKLGL